MDPHAAAKVAASLRTNLEKGLAILVLGAGFSRDARDRQGRTLPLASELAAELWPFCNLPGAPDATSSLADIYAIALQRNRHKLAAFLRERLTIDSTSLPSYYSTYLRLPWTRIYTLNIDDLLPAIATRFAVPRTPRCISGVSQKYYSEARRRSQYLEVIHLNGHLDDIPDDVTFSTYQYAERVAVDAVYARLATELVSHAVVFIGTQLDEPNLWYHIAMRRMKGPRGVMELRPRSYLVTPQLSPARASLLSDLCVEHLPLTASTFEATILGPIAKSLPQPPASVARRPSVSETPLLQFASQLANLAARTDSNFLLGAEPIWADILTGRAVERDIDREVLASALAHFALGGTENGLIILSGTAGSGKSTTLLRLCLALASAGHDPLFVERDAEIGPHALISAFRTADNVACIAIDDVDRFGGSVVQIIEGLFQARPGALVIVGLRSSRTHRHQQLESIKLCRTKSHVMPHLTDGDIDLLIAALDRHHRLGVLKGRSHAERVSAFRQQAGRQLLVAMIQATSGRRFEDRVVDEFRELDADARLVYAVLAVATERGFAVPAHEVLLAVGEATNEAMNRLNDLVRSHLVVEPNPKTYRLRHREIARVLCEMLHQQSALVEPIRGLAFAASSQVAPNMDRRQRPWALVKAILSRRYLERSMQASDDVRLVYDSVEGLLSWDYHYWLQRGSYELQHGDMALAQNHLGQAFSLEPNDALVQTEYAHLQFQLAITAPGNPDAPELANAASMTLEELVENRGVHDSYPFHVLGSQSLGWSRRMPGGAEERRAYLRRSLHHVEHGCAMHPWSAELRQLRDDIRHEILALHVPGPPERH